MKANETKVEKFLATNETSFAIPVYQRNYDWTTAECKQLFNDIIDAGTNDNINAHFIGSIVYVHDDVYSASGLTELTVIDGQQRLTTLTLIYVTIYRLAKEINNQLLANRIHKTYLINEFAIEEEKLKLKPTDNNVAALRHIMSSVEEDQTTEYSRIIENFNFFKSVINNNNLEAIQKGLSKLIFVDIALDRQRDNPQRIFESLNSTGLELSQADLIRNYILMGLARNDQEFIYRNYWDVIEQSAKDDFSNKSRVSDFIRDYLTLINKEIPNKGDVYNKFKLKYPTTTRHELEIVLTELRLLVRFYSKLVNPKNESDKEIRIQLEYISRLEINVAFPFLMKVYRDYSEKTIDKHTFVDILLLVQSFTWRRFILGLPTNALNKIFMTLHDKIDKDNYFISLQIALLRKTGVQRFPSDTEIVNTLKERDMYNIKPKNRVYFLERLENYSNNELVSIDDNEDITIEHIFPQNPDIKWRADLGQEQYNFIKENYLHTIGNLTLSGNNGKLSNRAFLEKRDMNVDGKEQGYIYSRLWLNRSLAELDYWNKEAIEARTQLIVERFLKIWPVPNITVDVDPAEEVNIFDADDPTDKKLEYAIFFDKKFEVKEVAKLFVEVFKQLFELEPKTFFTPELSSRINLVSSESKSTLRSPVQMNESYYFETGYSNKEKFKRMKQALQIFGFEDELSIKYA